MAKPRWHILRDSHGLTLTRRLPVRLDLSAKVVFPNVRKLYLAQQIRQDLWRRLQNLRGFAPVVRIENHVGGVLVTAGGQVDGMVNRSRCEAEIQYLLMDQVLQARWLSQAKVVDPQAKNVVNGKVKFSSDDWLR